MAGELRKNERRAGLADARITRNQRVARKRQGQERQPCALCAPFRGPQHFAVIAVTLMEMVLAARVNAYLTTRLTATRFCRQRQALPSAESSGW